MVQYGIVYSIVCLRGGSQRRRPVAGQGRDRPERGGELRRLPTMITLIFIIRKTIRTIIIIMMIIIIVIELRRLELPKPGGGGRGGCGCEGIPLSNKHMSHKS